MAIVYFVIAVLALAGAGALLWLDRNRSQQVHHQRAVWGETHSFKFRETDSKLRTVFHRAAMDAPEHVQVRDVAYGVYDGAEAVVFDLEDTATIVAVRRPAASSVTVDLRYEDVLAPAEDDVDLLGAMGSRVMFASNLDAARRICDRRMVTLATETPSYIEILWNEGNWALGAMPVTTEDERLDVALDTVRRFVDLLRVLPPAVVPQDAPDPRDPHGPTNDELADEKTESLRDKERRRRSEEAAAAEPREPKPSLLDATPRPAEPQTRPGPPRIEPIRGRSPRPAPEPRSGRERFAPPDLPPLTDPRDR
ncbi:hypothetical protein [Gordonia hydrophobica]|uniref:Secreted protein n=1 Tax=Gordonia hydrophobica TaxID=40516 RepID=A0ABZ2U6Y2_9ACTN|nr:hypothetical protein [Gordonia hydrophobica]MBM7365322.1 hypothetical protein [Gordonia hydrophobica]